MPNVNVYLLDEPSSFLDSEQRIIASKVIKRYAFRSIFFDPTVTHGLVDLSYTLRKRRLSSSTILLWLPILRTVSSYSRDNPPSQLLPRRK